MFNAVVIVSIRARPIGRAMPTATIGSSLSITFQSAPGQLAGRCPIPPGRTCPLHRFNPRPANWPGDAAVSPGRLSLGGCFNPRPANWPGDAVLGMVTRPMTSQVSIRARPIGRAMPGCTGPKRDRRSVSIRARPIGRAMLVCVARIVTYSRFQSAPGQLAGRCPLRGASVGSARRFQSAPGQLAGRCLQWREPVICTRTFQSAPGQLAGRCPSSRFGPSAGA